MFKRATVVLLSALTCCALICVGFSSWSVTSAEKVEQFSSGSINSEDVIYSDDYVSIDTIDKSKFVVTEMGFSNGTTMGFSNGTTTGSFTVQFKINVGNCQEFARASGADTLTVQVTLSFANNQVLSELFSGENTISFSCVGDGVTPQTPSKSDSSFVAEFALTTGDLTVTNADGKTTTRTGTFTFTFTLKEDVYKAFYNALEVTKPSGEQKEATFGNPLSLVVAVSNGK